MNSYKILGLPTTASAAEIKARYRELASQHHPDRGGDAETFTQLSQAFRAAYKARVAVESRCPRCCGKGKVTQRRGFSSLQLTCPDCKGSGEVPRNLKEQAG